MRIGISVASLQLTHDARVGARNMIERVSAAYAAGFDTLFVGDHHITAAPYFQNSPILGRLLAGWGPRDAGALYLLPLWNPVLLAEQTATLASIAEGRFILQCGIGGGAQQFAGMGVDIRKRPSMFEQSIEIMRALWAGETVDHDGRWQLRGARISPTPPEPIEIWIGASADAALDRAARLGDAWLADPGSVFDVTSRQLEIYRDALAKYGKTENRLAIRRDVYVGESKAEALASMERYIGKYRGFDPAAMIIGDVAEVADRIRAYQELGFTDLLMRNISRDQSKALKTIERMGAVRELLA